MENIELDVSLEIINQSDIEDLEVLQEYYAENLIILPPGNTRTRITTLNLVVIKLIQGKRAKAL